MKKPNRLQESLAASFTDSADEASLFILTASSDTGVRLNFGRPGARFAPKSILNSLKKMACHTEKKIFVKEVSSLETTLELSQKKQIEHLNEFTQRNKPLIHIGGGHDHIYPFVIAQENAPWEELLIINIDAHLDTRVSDFHHSGSPFRDLDRDLKKKTTLLQYGIHSFANTKSTQTNLSNIEQHIISFEKIKTFSEHFTRFPSELIAPFMTPKTKIILSLDVDALESSLMQGVSAVNHEGLPLSHIREFLSYLLYNSAHCDFGIYEYNPLFDDLSQKGSRAIASLIYDYLEV